MAKLEEVKSGKNYVLYKGGIMLLKNVRVSYPHLDKPYAGKDAKEGTIPKFGIVSMLSNKDHAEAKKEIEGVIAGMLKEKKLSKMPPKDKFYRNGDDEKEDVYTDHWIVSAREERQPAIRNRRGELVTDPRKIADLIAGGYWCNVLIRPWFQDNSYGQKINAGLVAVQHVKDDETFGEGRIDDSDVFDSLDDEDGGNGMDDNDADEI